MKALAERIAEADMRGSNWLADGNDFAEQGNRAMADRCYARAQFWLDRSNNLRGCGELKAVYTKRQLAQFDRITNGLHSPDQLKRIQARIDCKKFQATHGKEKCDAMFAELKKRDAGK